MGYANGMDFQNDFQELLTTYTRDMVNSLTTQDFVYISSKEDDDSTELISVLHFSSKDGEKPLSQETMKMMYGERPLYSLRYSSVKMLNKPPLFEVYNPHVEERLTIMLAKRIPEILTEIATEYSAIEKKLEAESKQRWREQNKPPCSDRRDCTCADGCNCNKLGKVEI